MNRKNIMLAVVGDSAAGKTTLTEGIVNALGPENVTAICSDDYHRYNRKQRKELGISALDPECNYIDIMEQHFRLLQQDQPILKPVYNHGTGDFDAPVYIEPTKFIIIEGLLPLHTRRMRLSFDVKVFLAPPEELRRTWKVKRDTTKRGYSSEQVLASLEKRKDVSPKFIQPQRAAADMVVRFYPPEGQEEETGDHLNAQLVLRPTIPHPDLTELLTQSGNGNSPAIRLELGRYDGKPVDFLEIDGNVTPENAKGLENLLNSYLSKNNQADLDGLGGYQDGHSNRKSYPLALIQLLIAYQMTTAEEIIKAEL